MKTTDEQSYDADLLTQVEASRSYLFILTNPSILVQEERQKPSIKLKSETAETPCSNGEFDPGSG